MNGFRQVVLFSILALYLVGNVHLAVARHYCGGELEAISLYEPITCCGEEEEDNGCCENEIDYIAQDNHHKQVVQLNWKTFAGIDACSFYIEQVFCVAATVVDTHFHSAFLLFKPPPLRWFIVFCSLVI